MADEPSRRPAHAPPRPINAYAIFLKTSYAWTRKRLGAAAPELAVLDEIAKEWDALDEAGRDPYEALAAKDAARYSRAAAAYRSTQVPAPRPEPAARRTSPGGARRALVPLRPRRERGEALARAVEGGRREDGHAQGPRRRPRQGLVPPTRTRATTILFKMAHETPRKAFMPFFRVWHHPPRLTRDWPSRAPRSSL
jgi:hypothetical protein